MKRITEEYGTECNLIESTLEEFYMMKEFLKVHGIEARKCTQYGNTCIWQIRNGYKDWTHLNNNNKVCQSIINIVEENISSNAYAR